MDRLQIVSAKPSDYPGIVSAFSTSTAGQGEYERYDPLRQEALLSGLSEAIEDQQIYAMKNGSRVLGFAWIGHIVEEELFPKTQSYSKTEDVLEAIGYHGEPTMVLRGIFIDKKEQGHKYGNELFHSLLSRYKGATWIAAIEEGNRGGIHFLEHLGFLPCPIPVDCECGDTPKRVYAKTFRPSGLCREARW